MVRFSSATKAAFSSTLRGSKYSSAINVSTHVDGQRRRCGDTQRRFVQYMDKISRSLHIRAVTLPRIQPIIPTWRKEPFDDPEWLFEFKYDGFRGLCYLEPGRCRFISPTAICLVVSTRSASR